MRLEGKVAFITGAGLGIGRAAAVRFAEEGAKVVAAARREEHLIETVRRIKEAGGEASYIVFDTAKENDVIAALAKTAELYGGIDILVNCAAVYDGMGKTIEDVTAEEVDRELEVNVKGYFLTCKYVLPYMRKRGGGSIINTSSISAFIGQRKFVAYNATKGAIEPMTKCIAVDFGWENIRANTVCPAYVLTEQTAKHHEHLGQEKLKKLHPIGRAGKPEDVANAMLYLASDESSWVTGTSLVVDGGYLAV